METKNVKPLRRLHLACAPLAIVFVVSGAIVLAQQSQDALQTRKAELEIEKLQLEVNKLKTPLLLDWLPVILGLVVGVLGAASTIWVARRSQFAALDQSVHEKRLELYPQLVEAAAPLAVYFPAYGQSSSLDPAACSTMGKAMSRWYFSGGGLLLSRQSRDAYFKLTRALTKASRAAEIRAPRFPDDAEDISVDLLRAYRKSFSNLDNIDDWTFGSPTVPVDEPAGRFKDYVFLQRLSSDLRTALAEDLGSRRRPVGVNRGDEGESSG